MSAPHREPDAESAPCPEEVKEVADELASLHDQRIDPLTGPQKGAVKYIERRLREAVEESDAEGDRGGARWAALPVWPPTAHPSHNFSRAL